MTEYPIHQITCQTATVTVQVIASAIPEDATARVDVGGFDVQHACAPAPATLVFVPTPATGLAHVQAQEQCEYEVWLTWEGDAVPQVFLGADTAPLPMRRCGQQAYLALNWGNYVGASMLRVQAHGQIIATLPVEVRSRKMGYLDDYRVMLDDISEQLAALIFDYDSPTSVYAPRRTQDVHVAYLDYLFLRYLMAEHRLPLAFRLVQTDPHRATVREAVWQEISQVRNVTARAVYAMAAHPEHLTRPARCVAPAVQTRLAGHVPQYVLDERVITNFDTPPNRFVKHLLAQLILKLRELEACFATEARGTTLAGDCARWRRTLEYLSRAHFLEDVGAMHVYPAGSQVLLKRDGYRRLNDYYRRFLLTGKVTWEGLEDLLQTPNKDLATLYEYWGFFQLLDAVAAAVGVDIQPRDFVVEENGIFRVTLNQSGRSRGRIGAATVYYNRYFSPRNGESYSVTLHPDYVVELPDGRRFIFDAKYRYDYAGEFMSAEADPDEERAEDARLRYKKGDLYKMHTYRDALRAQAVFILYPGNEFRAYQVVGAELAHPAELSPTFAGVGAIAMQVGKPEALRTAIRRLLAAR